MDLRLKSIARCLHVFASPPLRSQILPESSHEGVLLLRTYCLNIKKENMTYDVCARPVRRLSIKSPSATAPLFFSTSTLLLWFSKTRFASHDGVCASSSKTQTLALDESRTPALLSKVAYRTRMETALPLLKTSSKSLYECSSDLQKRSTTWP